MENRGQNKHLSCEELSNEEMLDVLTELGVLTIRCDKTFQYTPKWCMSLTIIEEEYSELTIENKGDTFQEVVAHTFNSVKRLSGE